jgi:hypothetical protein
MHNDGTLWSKIYELKKGFASPILSNGINFILN